MNMTIRSKVVKIGNSRGIRIPRTILEQAGLTDEVEMKVEGNQLIINAFHLLARGGRTDSPQWLSRVMTSYWMRPPPRSGMRKNGHGS